MTVSLTTRGPGASRLQEEPKSTHFMNIRLYVAPARLKQLMMPLLQGASHSVETTISTVRSDIENVHVTGSYLSMFLRTFQTHPYDSLVLSFHCFVLLVGLFFVNVKYVVMILCIYWHGFSKLCCLILLENELKLWKKIHRYRLIDKCLQYRVSLLNMYIVIVSSPFTGHITDE